MAALAYLTACPTSSRAFYALVQANPYRGLPVARRSSWHFLVDSREGGKWRVEGGEACRGQAEAAESRFQPRNKRFCAFPGIWANPHSFSRREYTDRRTRVFPPGYFLFSGASPGNVALIPGFRAAYSRIGIPHGMPHFLTRFLRPRPS